MADKNEPKTVRLQNAKGIVVETTEENAARLSGFEPIKASSSKKSDGK